MLATSACLVATFIHRSTAFVSYLLAGILMFISLGLVIQDQHQHKRGRSLGLGLAAVVVAVLMYVLTR
jgi:predicted tellurium resistance membrane protein TerC